MKVLTRCNTTTLSSFTDGLIPSVTAMKSVGENNTDGITDGTRPSVYQSSVNPISVTKSVANKKKNTHRRNTDGLTDGYARAKKKVSRGNITDGINPSEILTEIPSVIMAWLVIVLQLSVKYRRILSVGNVVGI